MSTRILRLPEVCHLVGLSPSSVSRLCRSGKFVPKRVLSANCVGWIEDEVVAWVRDRTAGSCRPKASLDLASTGQSGPTATEGTR
jgi:prophage regulatory protein